MIAIAPNIDLHIHTILSGSSTVTISQLAESIRHSGYRIGTATDFGSLESCRQLANLLPGWAIVCGLEVRAAEGHFLIFSMDENYLTTIPSTVESVRDLRRDETTALIWAHPFISQRVKSFEAPALPEVQKVAPYVDGLELFNGTMINLNRQQLLRLGYFQNLMRIAIDYNLAMTGGSDAHEPLLLGKCWTSFPVGTQSATDVIRALKERTVMPHYDHVFFDVRIPLG